MVWEQEGQARTTPASRPSDMVASIFLCVKGKGNQETMGPESWKRSQSSPSGRTEWPAPWGSPDLLECPGKILGFRASHV